ncbi:MAG: putative LPS assembly protein LptD, partial [Brumimicrobium sp.]|nr:putative LPS assembly protein LptD [Brumimicrobium sp.]
MSETTYYSCTDSIVADLKSGKISLYGDARVEFEGIILTAGLIEMDMEKNEVYAIYQFDADSNRIGIPKFEEGTESFTAASIRYNFETKKGYIEELKTQQEEMYLHMGVAKRHTNDEIHFTEGKFTTCELDEPHFHFALSKAVMVPDERIATGPMNLWVQGIPTPLGLPFSIIPTKDRETSGLIFPMFVPTSQYGFGLQDLGYYFPIKQSEQIQTTVFASLYSQGTFELRNQTDYRRRYKFTGMLNLGYGSFRQPFPNDSIRLQKITVQWNHQQEAKANPYWNFNSRVNFVSDNNGQTTLDPLSDQYFQNQFNSDINLVRTFPGKPVTMGLKSALKQNSVSGNIDIDLPTFTTNVNRFFPLKVFRNNNIGSRKF